MVLHRESALLPDLVRERLDLVIDLSVRLHHLLYLCTSVHHGGVIATAELGTYGGEGELGEFAR